MESRAHSPHPISVFVGTLNVWFKLVLLVLGFLCVAAFGWWIYTQAQNSIGLREWTEVRTALEARGEKLDWAAFIPPPVPAADNFAATPLIEDSGYKGAIAPRSRNKLNARNGLALIDFLGDSRLGKASDVSGMAREIQTQLDPATPRDTSLPGVVVVDWMAPAAEALNELRAAAGRPHARFRVPTNHAFGDPTPNFVFVRATAQTFAVMAAAEVNAGRPADALQDIRVILRFVEALEAEGSLVTLMIRVALLQLVIDAVWEGSFQGAWTGNQLQQLEVWLAPLNLPADFLRTMRAERAGANSLFAGIESFNDPQLGMPRVAAAAGLWARAEKFFARQTPRGWIWSSQAHYNLAIQEQVLTLAAPGESRVHPERVQAVQRHFEELGTSTDRRTYLARIAVPNFARALVNLAETQARLDMCRLALALERHRQVQGALPEELTSLDRQFLSAAPVDVIGGEPYRFAHDGTLAFRLWSVGWNQIDDGGVVSTNREVADWVWFSQPVSPPR